MNTKHLKVLLIEDNPGDQRLIREMLVGAKNLAIHLDAVRRLSEGLERLVESQYDVILLDLCLPDSNGVDTFVRVQAAAKETPVVVLSGLNDEKMAVESVQAGAQDYLIKGEVDGSLLVRSLRYAIERGGLERERSHLLDREHAARLDAEAANRAKDEFLAIVSHELRTPLNAILGWSRMLRMGNLGARETSRAMEALERNANAQRKLIEDLLDISRITTGKLQFDALPVNLVPVINTAIEAIRPAAEAKEIRLETLFDSGGRVLGDANRLGQIVSNLLSNAVKFNSRGGCVQVKLVTSESVVALTVSDRGSGIRPEFLPYVFDRFRQADSSSTRRHGGLGLGLSIVRHLVTLHRGTVHVDSPGEGQGATFTVKLPMLTNEEQRTAKEPERPLRDSTGPPAAPSLDGIRVLLVEDHDDSRDIITAILKERRAEVLAVSSATEALEAIERWQPDVLLSDIEMPDEDGYSFLRKLRKLDAERGGQIPAAAVTGHGRAEDHALALAAGYQIHMTKPVDPVELSMVVAKLAEGYKERRKPREDCTE